MTAYGYDMMTPWPSKGEPAVIRPSLAITAERNMPPGWRGELKD